MTMKKESDEESKSLSLADLVAAVRRRARVLVSVIGVGVVVTVALAMFTPATFRSTGTILIEQQEVPPELVRSTVTSYADQRLQVITQRVMTTQNLLEIIRRYNLYPRMLK